MKRDIRSRLPVIVAGLSIVSALFLGYFGTMAVNHTLKGSPIEMPAATRLFIWLCRYQVTTAVGLLTFVAFLHIDNAIPDERRRRDTQLIIMGAFLFLLGLWFFSMSIAHLGWVMDEWLSWE